MADKIKTRAPKLTPLEKRLMLDASLPAIAGQVLWLDGDDASTVLDADGDSAATGTGGANNGFGGTVATWRDKSGSGFHVTNATANQQPLYNATGLNGNGVLTFDGVNDKLRNTGAVIPGNDVTMFIVYNRTTAVARDAVFELGGGASRNAIFINDSGNRVGYYSNSAFYNSSGTYTTSQYELVSAVHDITTINMWRNGANQVNTTGLTRASTTGIYVGDDSSGGDDLQGNIAEIIVYDRDLTSDERRDVENYLASKWGLTLASNSNPVLATNTGATVSQSDPVVITSAMLNATDADNTEAFLRYTITDLADYGTLTNTNTAHTYTLGEYFTQSDIDSGYIAYTHGGTANFTDSFSFTVTDQYATTAAATFNLTITPDNVAPVINGWTLVSSEDFQSGATGWNNNTTFAGGGLLTTFLGRYSLDGGVQTLFKTYTLSGTENSTVIEFDMYKLDTWDGETFRVFINDVQSISIPLQQGTFNSPANGSSGIVSYTVQELTPFLANLGSAAGNDQIFRFTLTIQNGGAGNVKLGFSSTLNQAVGDESWGVDNVKVYEVGNGGTPGPYNIVENSAIGTVVGNVAATDADGGQTVTYSIVGGTGASVFTINASTGVITTTAALNYESVNSYTLTVRATDNGTPSLFDTETITITIVDMPENTAPTANALGPITIAENTANGTTIGTITGSDPEGDTITWSITAGNTDNIFAINAATGAIRVNSNTNLNYEWDNSYTLTIRAQDNGFGNLTATRNVVVNISNINEAPTFNIPQSFLNQNPYLRYNAATGNFYQYVGTTANFTAASAAAAANLLNGVAGHLATITSAAENTYVRALGAGNIWLGATDSVVEGEWRWVGGGAEAGQMFWLGAAAGAAQGGYYTNWLTANPDNSSNEDHLEMQASGLWNDALTSTAKAYVIEWEGTAVMAALGNGPFTMAENPALNQSVGFVYARDADAGDTIAYSITGGSGAAHYAVNATTGEITVTNPSAINFESATSFTLDIRAQDVGGLFSTQTVTINITNVNEAPVLNPGGPFTVTENSANNTLVGTMTASDPDAATTLTYSITSGDPRGVFSINNSGQIRIANTNYLDYELQGIYTLNIRVSDGTLTDNETITINLTNVNENPSFDAIQRVLNSDPTLKYNATTGNFYRFVSGTANYATAEANAAAALLNGQAGYVAAINSAAESTFIRTIIPTTIWINGTDTAVEGEWRYTSGPNAGDLFWLGAAAGSAQNGNYTNWSGGEPNNSGGNEDAIEFRTTGAWNDTNIAGTRAYVIEWNGADVLATLQNGPYTINENSALNSIVGTVTANDPEGGAITYSITGGSGAGVFSLNAATGEIRLIAPVDHETADSYTLDLRAEDPLGGFTTMTITIGINDINETPVLAPGGPFTVTESAANGTLVGTMAASDVDDGQTLTYSIVGGNTHGIFSINNAGEIRVANNTYLDYELLNTYTLQIRVTDNGTGALFDQENVTINLTNVNEAPSFDPVQRVLNSDPTLRYDASTGNFYRFVSATVNNAAAHSNSAAAMLNGVAGYLSNINSAAENAFVRGISRDVIWVGGSDIANEGQWIYTQGPDAGDLFWVGTAGGSAQNGHYTNWGGGEPNDSGGEDGIEMRADGLWNDMNVAQLRGYVIEWNGADVLSSLQHGPYNVPEHSPVNFNTGTALANDADAGDVITYSITGGTGSGLFSISASGVIRLTGAVNYEIQNSYTLDLRVQDAGGLFDTMTVTVNITDENDVPSVLNLTSNNIIENSGAGILVGTLSTADEDPADTHVYTLLSNPGGKFVIVGNEIRTAADIDYEQNQNFSVRIRVDDGNGGMRDRIFMIQVGDVMDTFTPPPSSGSGGVSGPYIPTDEEEISGTGNILQAGLGGEQGQSAAFYGTDGMQILRENITFQIRDLMSQLDEEERALLGQYYLGEEGLLPDIVEEATPPAKFTNIREALEFLQQIEDTNEGGEDVEKEATDDARAEQLPPNSIDRQFVDVMTYHQDRAARLREALMG